jgi:spermidine synthase
MTASLEKNEDGEISLLIRGDLQFDSSDEKIYHEALAIPALALAAGRSHDLLNVLVIGGGDGLVARELFKTARVGSVDLVDYDPEILKLAQREFAGLNNGSLSDSRINVHVEDAWGFVDHMVASGRRFDLIISDLTVPETAHEARFHSIDWYEKLNRLLGESGILAVNGVSPQATPQASWCVFNSLLQAGFQARPYHVHIPSFSARGYGDDWGFFLASPKAISSDELNIDLSIAEPRAFLTEAAVLQKLFIFPESFFAFQAEARPARAGSDILIHYFITATPLVDTTGGVRDLFVEACTAFQSPQPDSRTRILTPELSQALAGALQPGAQAENPTSNDVHRLLQDTVSSLPELQKEQTEIMIANFMEAPSRFLQGIDLAALTERLLRRAGELPEYLVDELRHLQEKLAEWGGERENLLVLGHRVMSILVLAIVLGNLLYPDAVYAKNGHGGYDGGWGGGGYNTYYNNPVNRVRKGPIGPGPNDAAVKQMRKQGALPTENHLASAANQAVNPKQLERDNIATTNVLRADRDELISQAEMLEAELVQYRSEGGNLVAFGTRTIRGEEAAALTEKALHELRQNILQMEARLARLTDKGMGSQQDA